MSGEKYDRCTAALNMLLQRLGSNNSRRRYRAIFGEWQEFISPIGVTIATATEFEAIGFRDIQRNRKNKHTGESISQHTIYKKLEILGILYDFLAHYEIAKENIFAAIVESEKRGENGSVRPPDSVDFGDVMRFVDAPSRFTLDGITHTALFAVMFGCALRVGEAVSLNLGDVKVTPEGIPFLFLKQTKNGKVRRPELPDWAEARLKTLIDRRRKQRATDTDALFVGSHANSSERMTTRTAHRIFCRYRDQLGLKGQITPHSARHTAAEKMRQEGILVTDIADALGHSSVVTTERYFADRSKRTKTATRKISYGT